MECRLNSNRQRSAVIRPESLNRMLTERYIMYRAMIRRNSLELISYATYTAWLRSYNNWPYNMEPTSDSLRTAGFFVLVGPTHNFLLTF